MRYPRPRAVEYEYSIAGVPGRPTAALPLGPFVLPGSYEVRITEELAEVTYLDQVRLIYTRQVDHLRDAPRFRIGDADQFRGLLARVTELEIEVTALLREMDDKALQQAVDQAAVTSVRLSDCCQRWN